MDITLKVGGETAKARAARNRGAYIKPCPQCHEIAGEVFLTEPPLLNWPHWWRCRCGNLWALKDLGLHSLPDIQAPTTAQTGEDS